MVIYNCPNCGKEFLKKYNYEMHTKNKKHPCRPKDITPPSSSENNENSSGFAPVNNNNCENKSDLEEEKIFKCIRCNRIFNKKYNLDRHLNGRCKIVEEKLKPNNPVNIDELDLDEKTKTILTILLNQNKKLIDEMNKIKEENKEIKEENKEIKEENKEMKEKIGKINVKKIKNINNNSTNNSHNTNNNTINNTIIVAHGKEDLGKIELETIMKCLSTIQYKDIIPNMTKHIYINDKKPENKNFCVVDMARNKCKYNDGNKWQIGKTTEKVNKIFDNVHTLLTDPFEKENINKTIEFIRANPKKFNEKWIKLSNTYLQSLYDEDDKENIENKLKILEEIKLIFFNNKEEILKLNC